LKAGGAVELLIVFRPRGLRSAAVKASTTMYAEALVRGSTLTLLDLPKGMEKLLKRSLNPALALEEAVRSGLLPSSRSALWVLEPVVDAAAKVAKELGADILCYGEASELIEEWRLAGDVARLTLRASIAGVKPRDLDEWLGLLKRSLELGSRSLSRAVDELAFHAARATRPICLAGLEAWELAKRLGRLGVAVELKSAGLPYLYRPLEVAFKLLAAGRLSREYLKQLVEEHVEFIKKFVMPSASIDEAYEAWLKSKAPWLARLGRSWSWSPTSPEAF